MEVPTAASHSVFVGNRHSFPVTFDSHSHIFTA
jgi:hypothetical protein